MGRVAIAGALAASLIAALLFVVLRSNREVPPGPLAEPEAVVTVAAPAPAPEAGVEKPLPPPAVGPPPAAPAPAPAEPAVLDGAVSLAGRVVESSSRPLAGIEVRVRIGNKGRAYRITEAGRREEQPEWESPTALTDAEGRFAIAGVPPAAYPCFLAVSPSGGAMGKEVSLDRLKPDEVRDVGDVMVYRPARVHGDVIDDEGKPVGGALVRVGRPVSRNEGHVPSKNEMVKRADGTVFRWLGESAKRRTPAAGDLPLGPGVSLSDSAGRFELRDVDPGEFQVSCRHQGWRDAIAEGVQVPEGGEAGPVHLVLERALSLTVSVLDGNGGSVAGADVGVSEERGQQPAEVTRGNWTGKTEPDGKAVFDGIRQPRVSVHATADGFMTGTHGVTLDARENQATIILQPGGEMIGRVVAAATGEPIRSFEERVLLTRSVIRSERGVIGHSLSLDGEGRFRERGLEPGSYTISSSGGGYRAVTLGPRPLEPGTTLDWGTIALEPGLPVDVLVVDGSGRPVAGAKVAPLYGGFREVTTDAQGKASFLWGDAEEIIVNARHPDFARGSSGKIAIPPGSGRIEAVVRLLGGGSVAGRALDEEGRPLPSTEISLSPADGRVSWSATSDAEGSFRFDQIPPGRYFLSISRRPLTTRASQEFSVESGRTATVDARQPPRRVLHGRVVDAAGRPAAGCTIEFGSLDTAADGSWTIAHPISVQETEADGSFKILDARPPTLRVTEPSGRRAIFAHGVAADPLVLRLPSEMEDRPAATATGRMRTVESGAPVAGVSVVLSTRTSDREVVAIRRFRTQSGLAGDFEMQVPAGSYRIEASHTAHATEERGIDIAVGGRAQVDLLLHPAGVLSFEFRLDPPARARIEIEVAPAGEPEAARKSWVRTGERTTLKALRRGIPHAGTVRAEGYSSHSFELRPGGEEGEPVRITLKQGGER